MLLGLVGDTTYNIVLLLHILTATAAFAPAFVHPVLGSQSQAVEPAERHRWMGFMAQNGRRIYAPALLLTGIFGFGLQGLSDGLWKFDQTWLLLALLAWVAMNGILHAVILPAERALAESDDAAAARRLAIGGPAITLLLVLMLYLMIWKPGF